MHKQLLLPDDDYWYWLAAAHRMTAPDFDLQAWRDIAQGHAAAHGNTARRDRQHEWEQKLGQALLAGTGWAHRITKPTVNTALPAIGDIGNTSLTAQLTAQVHTWRQWWKVDEHIPQAHCDPHLEDTAPKELTTEAFFKAAASFKAGTAHTDGLRPGTLYGISAPANPEVGRGSTSH
jgi:hypothetical protein